MIILVLEIKDNNQQYEAHCTGCTLNEGNKGTITFPKPPHPGFWSPLELVQPTRCFMMPSRSRAQVTGKDCRDEESYEFCKTVKKKS
jgi:hypothetical protein